MHLVFIVSFFYILMSSPPARDPSQSRSTRRRREDESDDDDRSARRRRNEFQEATNIMNERIDQMRITDRIRLQPLQWDVRTVFAYSPISCDYLPSMTHALSWAIGRKNNPRHQRDGVRHTLVTIEELEDHPEVLPIATPSQRARQRSDLDLFARIHHSFQGNSKPHPPVPRRSRTTNSNIPLFVFLPYARDKWYRTSDDNPMTSVADLPDARYAFSNAKIILLRAYVASIPVKPSDGPMWRAFVRHASATITPVLDSRWDEPSLYISEFYDPTVFPYDTREQQLLFYRLVYSGMFDVDISAYEHDDTSELNEGNEQRVESVIWWSRYDDSRINRTTLQTTDRLRARLSATPNANPYVYDDVSQPDSVREDELLARSVTLLTVESRVVNCPANRAAIDHLAEYVMRYAPSVEYDGANAVEFSRRIDHGEF